MYIMLSSFFILIIPLNPDSPYPAYKTLAISQYYQSSAGAKLYTHLIGWYCIIIGCLYSYDLVNPFKMINK